MRTGRGGRQCPSGGSATYRRRKAGKRPNGIRHGGYRGLTERGIDMAVLILVLLLALILGGAGFALHFLWWVAVIVAVLWLLRFFFRSAGSGGSRGRWYRW